jgi:hypothetical protein
MAYQHKIVRTAYSHYQTVQRDAVKQDRDLENMMDTMSADGWDVVSVSVAIDAGTSSSAGERGSYIVTLRRPIKAN